MRGVLKTLRRLAEPTPTQQEQPRHSVDAAAEEERSRHGEGSSVHAHVRCPTPAHSTQETQLGKTPSAEHDSMDEDPSIHGCSGDGSNRGNVNSSDGTPLESQVGKQGTMSVNSWPEDAACHQIQPDSSTLAISASCPPAMRRPCWSVHDFDLRAVMYHGHMSVVYHAVDKRSGVTVALKLYKRHKLSNIERHQVAREIKLHVGLNHPSIISLYAAWKDRSFVYLALEWAPGGDIYSFLQSQGGQLNEDLAVALILSPFLSGLAEIHAQGLIHRDVKPENILLDRSFQIKICDFGLSIDSSNEVANTRLGTIDYLAPEILDCPVKQHPQDNKHDPSIGYTNKVDCWSVGVLCYELLVGHPPFAASTAQQTLRFIRTKAVEYPPFLSPEAVDFLECSLVRDPAQRCTIRQLLDHPLITRHYAFQRAATGGRFMRCNSMPLSVKSKQPELSSPFAKQSWGAGPSPKAAQNEASTAGLRVNSVTSPKQEVPSRAEALKGVGSQLMQAYSTLGFVSPPSPSSKLHTANQAGLGPSKPSLLPWVNSPGTRACAWAKGSSAASVAAAAAGNSGAAAAGHGALPAGGGAWMGGKAVKSTSVDAACKASAAAAVQAMASYSRAGSQPPQETSPMKSAAAGLSVPAFSVPTMSNPYTQSAKPAAPSATSPGAPPPPPTAAVTAALSPHLQPLYSTSSKGMTVKAGSSSMPPPGTTGVSMPPGMTCVSMDMA